MGANLGWMRFDGRVLRKARHCELHNYMRCGGIMSWNNKRFLGLAGMGVACWFWGGAAHAQQAPAATGNELTEISAVVTAEKRSENILDRPAGRHRRGR